MKKPLTRIILFVVILLAVGLACSMPTASNPTLPPTAKPMSTEQIQQMEQQIQATLANPGSSGEVTITITQEQLNSYLSAQMEQQADKTLSDPSVVLTKGHAEVYAKVNQANLSAVAKIVLQPGVDANGNVKLDIVSISLGAFPVPDALKSRVSEMIDSMLTSYINTSSNQFKVKSIAVTEGQMTVTGVPQKQP